MGPKLWDLQLHKRSETYKIHPALSGACAALAGTELTLLTAAGTGCVWDADDTGMFHLGPFLLPSKGTGGHRWDSCPQVTRGTLQTTWNYVTRGTLQTTWNYVTQGTLQTTWNYAQGMKLKEEGRGGTFSVRAFCLPQSLLCVTELCFSGNA